jgi:hypothetical protein
MSYICESLHTLKRLKSGIASTFPKLIGHNENSSSSGPMAADFVFGTHRGAAGFLVETWIEGGCGFGFGFGGDGPHRDISIISS